MGRSTKVNSSEFQQYQQNIIKHPNYIGLDYSGSWVKTGKSAIGLNRLKWADQKIKQLGITGSGIYAKLMYEIHPFKTKPCQTCGREMSLNYVYPNKNFAHKLICAFPILEKEEILITSIHDIYKTLGPNNNKQFKSLLESTLKKEAPSNIEINDLINCLVEKSRLGITKALGPGAMSNFPDRFDGFHSYNRCCRATEDTGRSAENLKSYTKDRRAYEAWSDGNHRAANQLMGNPIFAGTGLSADHLGPISLGFVHDPRFMKVMTSGDNSSKRDRLILSDLLTMMRIENRENITAASWFCETIWNALKQEIQSGKITTDSKRLKEYQTIFKRNKDLFFKILSILGSTEKGKDFLEWYLRDRYRLENNYLYDYVLDINMDSNTFGQIKNRTSRNVTARADGEEDRAVRIGLDSIEDYSIKTNRKIQEELTEIERKELDFLISKLFQSENFDQILTELKGLMTRVQKRILQYSIKI